MREHPEETERCIELLLNLQLTVHQQRVPMLRKLKDKLQMQIQGLTCIDDVRRYELLTRLDSIKKHDKLCHGNFGTDNILIDQKNKTYIVDWVAAAQGNASADARQNLPFAVAAVPAGGRTIFEPVLPKDQYLEKICAGVAANCGCGAARRGQEGRTGTAHALD